MATVTGDTTSALSNADADASEATSKAAQSVYNAFTGAWRQDPTFFPMLLAAALFAIVVAPCVKFVPSNDLRPVGVALIINNFLAAILAIGTAYTQGDWILKYVLAGVFLLSAILGIPWWGWSDADTGSKLHLARAAAWIIIIVHAFFIVYCGKLYSKEGGSERLTYGVLGVALLSSMVMAVPWAVFENKTKKADSDDTDE